MRPIEAFTTGWKKSFAYGGKATRAEYWWFYLINLVAMFAVLILGIASGSENLSSSLLSIYWVASIFPSISIVVRRLRDIGKKWTWIFISFVPLIGGFWYIYLVCQPSGRYGLKEVSDL